MLIKQIVELSLPGMCRITPEEGASFYLRKQYLVNVDYDSIYSGAEFDDEQTNELLDAGLAAAVELKAITYLARAEQCHFKLAQKLRDKGFEKKYIEMALCYLESVNYLSDERFARAWIHSRCLNHHEGKSKLINELISRGISKEISTAAVEDHFSSVDEIETAVAALKKFSKRGKSDEKLIAAMMQSGFSYKQIKQAQEVYKEESSI